MKNTLFILSLLPTSFFMGVDALATPREHDGCAVRQQIVEPNGSQGYRMSEDCKTAYVLPPMEGQLKVTALTFAPSQSDCHGALASLDALSTESTTLGQLLADKASLLRSKSTDQRACSGVIKARDVSQTKLDGLKTKLSTDQAEVSKLKTQSAKCTKDRSLEGCDDVVDKLDDLNTEIQDLKEKITDAKEYLSESSDKVASCESQHPHSNDNSVDATQLETLEKQISALSPQVTDEMRRLSKQAGGAQGSMVFISGHTALVKAFMEENRGSNVSFVAMPLKDSHIIFQRVKKAANASTVAEFNIFGAQKKVPADENANGGIEAGAGDDADKLFGGAAGAQITLSLFASCRLRQQFGDLSSERAKQGVANMIRPTVKYNYELQATKSIRINYNESYLYSLIKTHSESGGLFWTSSSSSVTESTVANKWLTIVEDSEDTGLQFENPETRLFDLRREVLNAALTRAAKKTYVTTEEALADGGTPPKDGAKTAAEGLHKCPNVYCQVAAFAFDFADAVFSQSSSTGTTTKTVNLSDIENLVINGNIEFMGSQTFKYGNEW